MKRVMILGQPGSGKSTLARLLGSKTGLPVHHMDLLHWKSGWVERDRPEKIEMALDIERREAWIFEGGLSATYDHRLSRCDTLIVLDLPLWLRLWRVAKRTVKHYGETRPDLPDGCPEQFSLEFYTFIWRSRNTNRDRLHRMIAKAPPDVTVFHLTSRRAVRDFLAAI